MKIKLFTMLIFSSLSTIVFSQAKGPTIMVMPSKDWMSANSFAREIENQGSIEYVLDYSTALIKSPTLNQVISKISGLFQDRANSFFTIKNLQASLDNIKRDAARDAMSVSKSGLSIKESPYDKLMKVAKADILINIGWTTEVSGPKKKIQFRMDGIDPYTGANIANSEGSGEFSYSSEADLVAEAVLDKSDNFFSRLQSHFDDMNANGRKISLRIIVNSTDIDLETVYDSKELSSIIEKWVSENTVKGRFSTTDATESQLYLEQVRIPLFDVNQTALDARSWTKSLQEMLLNKYKITAKLRTLGLGQAELIIGEK